MTGLRQWILNRLRQMRAPRGATVPAHQRRSAVDRDACTRCGICHHICGMLAAKKPKSAAKGLED